MGTIVLLDLVGGVALGPAQVLSSILRSFGFDLDRLLLPMFLSDGQGDRMTPWFEFAAHLVSPLRASNWDTLNLRFGFSCGVLVAKLAGHQRWNLRLRLRRREGVLHNRGKLRPVAS